MHVSKFVFQIFFISTRTHLNNFYIPFNPIANESLNIVQLDQKWAKSFSLRQGNFTLPNGAVQLIDMLQRSDQFSWINHGVESHTPDISSHHLMVRIPLDDPKFSLVLMIPSTDIPSMLSEISPSQLTYYLKRLQLDEKQIRLTIPKFTIGGRFDFGPILAANNVTQFDLVKLSQNLTMPAEIKQVIQMSGEGMVESFWSRMYKNYYGWWSKERHVPEIVADRPFVYLVVGRYLDLNLKPAFETLAAGTYYGPSDL